MQFLYYFEVKALKAGIAPHFFDAKTHHVIKCRTQGVLIIVREGKHHSGFQGGGGMSLEPPQSYSGSEDRQANRIAYRLWEEDWS